MFGWLSKATVALSIPDEVSTAAMQVLRREMGLRLDYSVVLGEDELVLEAGQKAIESARVRVAKLENEIERAAYNRWLDYGEANIKRSRSARIKGERQSKATAAISRP